MSEPESCQGIPGFLHYEQQYLDRLESTGYADAFRLYNTDTDEFNAWPSGEHGVGTGCRTDLQIVSRGLAKCVEYAVIYKTKTFSSHSPVVVDYDMEKL
ncbi:MAG: exodeoxyribonuclease-3 [Porticoccus sp.]